MAKANEVTTINQAPITVPTQSVHPGTMIQALMSAPDLDVDKVMKLFEIQELYDRKLAREAYYEALSRLDAKVSFNKEASFSSTSYKYATLAHMLREIAPVMQECGLKATWSTGTTDGLVAVTCILHHKLGHSECTTLAAGPDTSGSKNSIQAVKSANSYLRRITLENMLGMAADEADDDDGHSAEAKVADKPTLDFSEFTAITDKFAPNILAGKGTSAGLIAKLITKYTLDAEQIQFINNLEENNADS